MYLLGLLFGGVAAVAATNSISSSGIARLPHFLCDNPLPHGTPWGLKTTSNSNPHTEAPDTGVWRHYNFTLTHQTINIDGIDKIAIVVNGQTPGPLIEANWGDWIEVTVHNGLSSPSEGTTLHWHGFEQRESQWEDGAPTMSQCPIVPGASFTYRFRADSYGTTWYHSHYSAQYADGAVGPMVIYGPSQVDYDYDLGPLMVSDYYHRDYYSNMAGAVGKDKDLKIRAPPSENNYINGKVSWVYNCSHAPPSWNSSGVANASLCAGSETHSGLESFRFETGKSHKLRLINSGAAAMQYFSIDEHELEVVAVDFVPVVPYNTSLVPLGIGQRVDVVVRGTGDPASAYWMRANIGQNCSHGPVPETKAFLRYELVDTSVIPTSRPHATPGNSEVCKNDDISQDVPVYPIPMDPNPDITKVIEVNYTTNASGNYIWTMNDETYRGNYSKPLFLLACEAEDPSDSSNYAPESLVYNFGSSKAVRIVMNNAYRVWHPMHIHGYHMQVIAEGPGYWDGHTVVNPANPLRRDTHILRPYGHLVIQIEADNPGIWPYHCHIAWHLSAGYNVNLMTQPQKIKDAGTPDEMFETCVDWAKYNEGKAVNQIDDGL